MDQGNGGRVCEIGSRRTQIGGRDVDFGGLDLEIGRMDLDLEILEPRIGRCDVDLGPHDPRKCRLEPDKEGRAVLKGVFVSRNETWLNGRGSLLHPPFRAPSFPLKVEEVL